MTNDALWRQGREVEDGDVFRFNGDFSAALYRVKINAIQLKESQEENKKTNEQVLQDRQYQVRPRLSMLVRCWEFTLLCSVDISRSYRVAFLGGGPSAFQGGREQASTCYASVECACSIPDACTPCSRWHTASDSVGG